MLRSVSGVVLLAAIAVAVLPRPAVAGTPSVDGNLAEWPDPPLLEGEGVKVWFGSDSQLLYFALEVPQSLRDLPISVTTKLPGLKSRRVREYWKGTSGDDPGEPSPCRDPKEDFRRPCRFVPRLSSLSTREFRLVPEKDGAWRVRASSALAEEAGFQGCCDQSRAAGKDQADGALGVEVAISSADLPPTTSLELASIDFEVRVGKVRLAGVGKLSTTLPWGPETPVAVALEASKVPVLVDPVYSARHACWLDTSRVSGPGPTFECYEPKQVLLPSPVPSIGVQWVSLPCLETVSGDPPCLGALELWNYPAKTDRHHEVLFPEPVFVQGSGVVCVGAGQEISAGCFGASCGDTVSVKLWAGCVDAKGKWTTAEYEAEASSVAVQVLPDGIHFYVEPPYDQEGGAQKRYVIRPKVPARVEPVQ